MAYKCKTCRATVPDGERWVYQVKWQDGSVSRELGVCGLCHRALHAPPAVPPATIQPPAHVAPVKERFT